MCGCRVRGGGGGAMTLRRWVSFAAEWERREGPAQGASVREGLMGYGRGRCRFQRTLFIFTVLVHCLTLTSLRASHHTMTYQTNVFRPCQSMLQLPEESEQSQRSELYDLPPNRPKTRTKTKPKPRPNQRTTLPPSQISSCAQTSGYTILEGRSAHTSRG